MGDAVGPRQHRSVGISNDAAWTGASGSAAADDAALPAAALLELLTEDDTLLFESAVLSMSET